MGQPQRQPSCLARELPQTRKLMCAPINPPVPLSCHSSARTFSSAATQPSLHHPPTINLLTHPLTHLSPLFLSSTYPTIDRQACTPTHPPIYEPWVGPLSYEYEKTLP